MKLLSLMSCGITLLPIALSIPTASINAQQQVEQLSQQASETILEHLDTKESLLLEKLGQTSSCTRKNISIRKEFGSLSKAERRAYTDAVLCLQSKPANTPSTLSAGARTRFDDFVVTHINLTPYVHNSGTFLGWHRYYLWIYEEALKTECGFTGSIPYWEWSKWADAPQDSPIFNGDDYSMGGNGEYIPHGDYVFNEQPPITLPAGLGGGCVTTGPFKDYVVNLGPIAMDDGSTVGPDGGLGYNPRCMTRDVGPGVAMKYTNWTAVMVALSQANVGDFQSELQGRLGSGTIGVHGGGHYTIGGNPGGDIFVSPADPTFYLHHAQIDRLWTIWQAMDPKNRQYELSGTNTMYNVPPSENTTLDYMINVTYSGGGEIAMRDVMSTTAGPFCYIYL